MDIKDMEPVNEVKFNEVLTLLRDVGNVETSTAGIIYKNYTSYWVEGIRFGCIVEHKTPKKVIGRKLIEGNYYLEFFLSDAVI